MTVVRDGNAPEGNVYVDDAITIPCGPREMGVPEMVIAGAPGVSVAEPM